jgi:Bacterial Ig-like domain (group 2)
LQPFYLSLQITGADIICSGSSPYTINGVPFGSSVIWTSSNTSIATVSYSGNNAIVTRVGDGEVTISATANYECANMTILSKKIILGEPSPINGPVTTYNVLKCIVRKYIHTVNSTGATNYRWFSRNITQGTSFGQFKNGPINWASLGGDGSCDQTEIKVEISNACNTASPQVITFPSDLCPPFTDGSCTYGRGITASPNPASNNVDITLFEEPNVKPKNTQPLKIEVIKILNKEGQTKKTIKGNNLVKMNIDISDLPNDVYNIMVFDGKAWITEQVIKN